MQLSSYIAAEHGRGARLARAIGKSPAFVSQMALRGRPVPPLLAVRVEQATGLVVRRWHMRPDDWHLIWPELIGTEGAPALPGAADAEALGASHVAG